MRIALATVGTTGDVARALAAVVGAEDGIGSTVTLLERAGSRG